MCGEGGGGGAPCGVAALTASRIGLLRGDELAQHILKPVHRLAHVPGRQTEQHRSQIKHFAEVFLFLVHTFYCGPRDPLLGALLL